MGATIRFVIAPGRRAGADGNNTDPNGICGLIIGARLATTGADGGDIPIGTRGAFLDLAGLGKAA